MTVALISGVGAGVGTLLRGGPLTSGLIAGAAGAIAPALIEGSTWQDVASSGLSGLLSGLTGAGFASLLQGTTMSGMQTAVTTGLFSGLLDAVLMGADPMFQQPDTTDNPCK